MEQSTVSQRWMAILAKSSIGDRIKQQLALAVNRVMAEGSLYDEVK